MTARVYRADPDAPREPVTAVRERAQLARGYAVLVQIEGSEG